MGLLDEVKFNQQAIEYVDATPDDGYALRILQAYRQNCNSEFVAIDVPEESKAFYEMLNDLQRKRAKILDEAIEKLTK